jgi:formylglycine-generating enzyme required for sulfatase activity
MKKIFYIIILLFITIPIYAQADKINDSVPVPEIVFIKGGKFIMGDHFLKEDNAMPEHEVKLNNFYLGKYEVTNTEYCAFINDYGTNQVKEGVYKGKKLFAEFNRGLEWTGDVWKPVKNYEQHPVVNVSWYGAREYCVWLSQKTGQDFRLPTEAEWEYAAGGGEQIQNAFSGTSFEDNLGLYAWYDQNSDTLSHRTGSKDANEIGLHDMSGNVYEWCSDFYAEDYYATSPKKNPRGPTAGTKRVVRGGCFYTNSVSCTVSFRGGSDPDYMRGGIIGFRICADK